MTVLTNKLLGVFMLFFLLHSSSVVAQLNAFIEPSIKPPVLCKGQSIVLTAEVVGGTGTPPFTYYWYGPVGLSSTNGFITETPLVTTTYYVDVTDKNGLTDNASLVVTVNQGTLPVIKANGSLNLCEGQSVVLETTFNFSAYQWKKDNVDIPNEMSKSYTANSAGSYSVFVTDNGGCSGTSNQLIVKVNPLPNVTITAIGSTTICKGKTTTLQANNNFSSYQWKKDGVNIPGAVFKNFMASESGDYSLEAADANGCFNVSNIINIIVNDVPVVTASTDKMMYCEGDVINFSSGGGISYSWSGPNNFFINQQNFTRPNANISMSGFYSVIVTNQNGCMASGSINVEVNKFPDANIIGNTSYCSESKILLSVTSGSNYLYQWSGPNGFTGNTSSVSVKNTGNINSGTYEVTISNKTCNSSGSINVTVNSRPNAFLNFATTGGSLYEIISESTQGDQAIVSLKFDFSDTNVKDSLIFTNNPALTFERNIFNSTGLELIVTDAAGCSDTAYQDIIVQSAGCKYKLKDPTSKICGAMKFESSIAGESLNISPKYEIEWKLFDLSNNNQLLIDQKRQLDQSNFSTIPPYFPDTLKVKYDFNKPGSYKFELKFSNLKSNGSIDPGKCNQEIFTQVINVYSKPEIKFDDSVIKDINSDPVILCKNNDSDVFEFKDIGSNDGLGVNYAWQQASVLVSTANKYGITGNAGTGYSMNLTKTNDAGCSTTKYFEVKIENNPKISLDTISKCFPYLVMNGLKANEVVESLNIGMDRIIPNTSLINVGGLGIPLNLTLKVKNEFCSVLVSKNFNTTFNNVSSNDSLRSYTCNGITILVYPESGKCYEWVELTETGKLNYPILPVLDPKQQFVQAKQGSHYFVRVYDCASSNCGKVTQPRTLDDNDEMLNCDDKREPAVTIFPNPNQGNFSISLDDFKAGSNKIIISDLFGRNFLSQLVETDGQHFEIPINITRLPANIYQVSVMDTVGVLKVLQMVVIK